MMQTLNDVVVDVLKAYVLNALWQVPLLWLAAETVAKWTKPSRAVTTHRLWASCLMLAVVLPGAPLLRHTATTKRPTAIQAQPTMSAPQKAAPQAAAQMGAAGLTQPDLPDAPQTLFGEAKDDLRSASAQATRKMPWKLIGVRVLCIAYIFSVFFAMAKLSWGLWRTARLLRRAKPTSLQPTLQRVWEQCCARSYVDGVRLLSSAQVASPSTLTFRSAVILLPSTMPECGEAEMAAALCHELAHVRRRDFLKNLAYEFIIAPLFFHPVVHAMARRVQETRELACDDMAAEMLDGRAAYASSLLRLAEKMSASVAQTGRALGVFEGNVLEKRVMNLIETKVKQSGWKIVVPAVCGMLMLAASCAASVRFGMRPVFANTAKTPATLAAVSHATPTLEAMTGYVPLAEIATQPEAETVIGDPNASATTPVGGDEVFEPAELELQQPSPAPSQVPSWLQNSSITDPPQRIPNPGDLKPITFQIGKTYFEPGDAIVIDELHGTGSPSSGENLYEIKGHYTLASHDSALLAASVTSGGHGGGSMNMSVDKGGGQFTLWLWKHGDGSPHLSFYPAGGGSSFGGVYFDPASPTATAAVPAPAPGQTRGAPKGWSLQGDDPTNYLTGVDNNVTHDGHASAYLLAVADNGNKFGTLSQWFKSKDYLGKRVRFRAWVRSKDVTNWAGLWMRVDEEKGQKSVAFDNMQNRAIKGTTDWKLYDVVLEVPKSADDIDLGILLTGPGEVWMSGVQVEVVGPDVATTDIMGVSGMPSGPTNLDFGK